MKRLLMVAAVTATLAFSFPEKSEACGRLGWVPGKNLVRVIAARRSSAKSRGGWYFGKNLGL